MEVGIGLDSRLGLRLDELRDLARDALNAGYASAWTPYGTLDPFLLCALWWETARAEREDALGVGVAVVPVRIAGSTLALAKAAATLATLTNGRFVLGVGSGAVQEGALALMREHIVALRALLRGETVDGRSLGFRPPQAPVFLGALGPRMLRLAGAEADGVALNWCATEHIAWSRARVAEGAHRAGRDPGHIVVAAYIRVCVDEDEEAARDAIAGALLPYALVRPGAAKDRGYRAHFARMGWGDALDELEARRDRGASVEELTRAFPTTLLRRVGAWGQREAVRDGFSRLAQGLDVAIARVLTARPGSEPARAAIEACRP